MVKARLYNIFIGFLAVAICAVFFVPFGALADVGAPPIVQTSSGSAGDTTAFLNGSVNPDGAATNYWFEYGTDQWSLQARTGTQSAGSTGTSSISVYASLTNLSSNLTYYFRVVGQNVYGTSYGNTLSFTTNSSNWGSWSAPTVQTVYGNSLGATSLSLSGQASPNQSDTSVWFEYGTSPSVLSNTTNTTFIGRSYGTLPFSQTISNLFSNTTYYFRAVARNSYGTAYGETLSARTDTSASISTSIPQAITDVPNAFGASAASLTGRFNPNGLPTSAWFEYGTSVSLGGRFGVQSVAGGTTFIPLTYTATDLVPGTTYYVRVVAQSSAGISYGSIQSFKTRDIVVVAKKTPTITANQSGTVSTGNVLAVAPSNTLSCLALVPNIGGTSLRAGGQFMYTVTYRNGCSFSITDAVLTIVLPNDVGFLSTDIPLTTLNANTLTYHVGKIARGTQTTLHVRGMVDREVLSGDSLLFGSLMAFTDGEGNNQNVNIYLSGNVTGGFSATAGLIDAFGSLADGWTLWFVLLAAISVIIYVVFFKKKADKTPKRITVVS